MNREFKEFLSGLVSYVTIALVFLFTCSDAFTAVNTTTHRSYALRLCSTCREIAFATEIDCIAAAKAEAIRVGATRESGAAVYTCVIRDNVIATFRPNAAGTATLSWAHDGLNVQGFRIVYGTRPDALTSAVQIADPTARSVTLNRLPPVIHYFAAIAYYEGNDSALSNIAAKAIL